MTSLADVAPAFVQIAHRIVWCTVATVSPSGDPRTRILHPIWEWDGASLTGWIATSPTSPKATDLATTPSVSLTYWDPSHDTCTAECDTEWEEEATQRAVGWSRFANGPEPVGYDPSIVSAWENPEAEAFGILRLDPRRIRVMDGAVMMSGGADGRLLSWSRSG